MEARLSSKGQIVIPKKLRDRLGLKPGTEFDVFLEDDRIILTPQKHRTLLESLYGKFAGVDFLTELEEEHRQEIESE
ncbi:MAG: AbrB/MazE/SpoVT family DNA-binding domain-containing protein [Chloroflexota bacterium]